MRHPRAMIASVLLAHIVLPSICVRAAERPIVRLELLPARTLPGVPVTARVTITNPNSEPLVVQDQIHVLVTPSQREAFYATDDTSSHPRQSFSLTADASDLPLGGGDSKTVVIPAHVPVGEPWFFADERLSWPGTYRLRLHVWSGSENALVRAESNEASLTVIEPAGDDAIVWRRMLELAGSQGWSSNHWVRFGALLAREVFETTPGSGYTAHLAEYKSALTPAGEREKIEHALSLRPEGPIAYHLAGLLAGWYYEAGERALTEGDLQSATMLYAQARRRATDVNRSTPYAWQRELGERWLAELDTDEELRHRHEARIRAMSRFTAAVTPIVECVDPGISKNDPYIVRFGYQNPNDGAKFIPPGKANDLTPGPPAQGQPRVFQPGRHRHVVSVTTQANQARWSLDGSTVTASRDTQPRCDYAQPEALAIRPVAECAESSDEKVEVRFGYENPNAVAIRIPAGTENRLVGASSTDEPPTIFEPGRHHGVLRVKSKNGAAVTWTVGGRTASSAAAVTGCGDR